MNGNQFDEFFRNKLGDYSSQVPEGMWERIKPKRDNDRKIIFFWICYVIIPGSLLMAFAGSHLAPTRHAHTQTPYIAIVHASGSQPDLPSATVSATEKTRRSAATHSKNPPPSSPGKPAPVSPGTANDPDIADNTSSSDPAATPNTTDIVHVTSITDPASDIDTVRSGTQPVPDPANRSAAPHKHPTLPPAQEPAQSAKTSKPSLPAKPSWYLDSYASPDLPFNSLQANNPLALQLAKKAQGLRLSYTTGLKLTGSFGKHFSATIGLQYSRINEKFQFDSLNPIVYNHFNSIDIPLLIGYTTGNDHFRATVNGGVIFNAHSWYNSTSADSTIINYKTNTGLSLYLGLNLARKVNDRISLFAEPYYRYRLSNITYDKQPVQRKINSTGISIGLRYNLSKPRKRK